MNSARNELRRNETDWTRPIVRPPITEHAITCAAGGANPALLKRAANACRRAAGRCQTAAHNERNSSSARAWLEDADELRAAAHILEKLP
jgi:hypothetical protein